MSSFFANRNALSLELEEIDLLLALKAQLLYDLERQVDYVFVLVLVDLKGING